MAGPNRFKLGLFAINCSGGMKMTKALERWDARQGARRRRIRPERREF
jgi:hypothetical protein